MTVVKRHASAIEVLSEHRQLLVKNAQEFEVEEAKLIDEIEELRLQIAELRSTLQDIDRAIDTLNQATPQGTVL